MSQSKIAKQIGVNQNYVSRFLRKFFQDNDIPWVKKLWWRKSDRFAKFYEERGIFATKPAEFAGVKFGKLERQERLFTPE